MNDLGTALHRAQDDPPPWQRDVDDFVTAGRRLRRRRRAGMAAGTSAAALLAAAVPLLTTALLHPGGDDAPPVPLAPAGAPTAASGRGGAATTPPGPASLPSGWPATTTPPATGDVEARLTAYVAAGYGYDDAVLLGRLWRSADPYDAKLAAGEKLTRHVALPIAPGQTAWQVDPQVAIDAFLGNGHTYAEAQRLARLWHTPGSGGDLSTVKATAGRWLLAGRTLPS